MYTIWFVIKQHSFELYHCLSQNVDDISVKLEKEPLADHYLLNSFGVWSRNAARQGTNSDIDLFFLNDKILDFSVDVVVVVNDWSLASFSAI